MPKKTQNAKTSSSNGANVGYQAELWRMADALRGSMDTAGYRRVVLRLLGLQHSIDVFEGLPPKFEAAPMDPDGVQGEIH